MPLMHAYVVSFQKLLKLSAEKLSKRYNCVTWTDTNFLRADGSGGRNQDKREQQHIYEAKLYYSSAFTCHLNRKRAWDEFDCSHCS